ncbi:MAG TPA: helix-turn-helix domain-containing protein [Acidimicrobiales bacterium]|nr:helix-turn-helix domain-containing protein [Acidimicrobiales bacterium]
MTTEDTERRVAFAMADATRLRVLRHIEAAAAPVGVAELAVVAGTSTQAVRRHLTVLVDAGLAVEELEHRTSRGRPRLLYRGTRDAAASATDASAYERLAVLQATARRTHQPPHLVGRAEGEALAATLDGAAASDAVLAVERVMAGEGFAPRVEEAADGQTVDVVLDHCPFSAAAAVDPAGVCQLHLGMAEGILAAIGGAELAALDVNDAAVAGCRLRLQRTHVLEGQGNMP